MFERPTMRTFLIAAFIGAVGNSASRGAAPVAPDPDPTAVKKGRFISFSVPVPQPGDPVETALRVRMVTLHHVIPPYPAGTANDFSHFEGRWVWVGPPQAYIESTARPTEFFASKTQCDPYYHNWSTVGLLHVTGAHIIPSSSYEIQQVPIECIGQEDACQTISASLQIATTRHGDTETPYAPPSTTTQPDVGDCSSLVNKFRSALGAPIKARAKLMTTDSFGNLNLAQDISFGDVAVSVDTFRCLPYVGAMGKCDGAPAPGVSGACWADEDCTGNNGSGPCNLYCPD